MLFVRLFFYYQNASPYTRGAIAMYKTSIIKIFKQLVNCMDADPTLEVQMFINIQRRYQSQVAESIVLQAFAETLRHDIWTGRRLPEVFYNSRSLVLGTNE